MEKIVTFGIAAYNAQQYLEKCLSSFIEASILDDIEVIIVDDGSTDQTAQIAQIFVDRYPASFHLIRQNNRGHGGALNTAVASATGRFFKAVDADDWVQTENLPAFVQALYEIKTDAVISSFRTVHATTGNIVEYPVCSCHEDRAVTVEELMKLYEYIAPCCSFHGITYRTDVYRSAGFCLTEKIFYEDNEYATIPFCQVKTVWLSHLFLYEYRIGNTYQSVDYQNQVKRVAHLERVIFNILDFQKSRSLSEAQNNYFLKKLYNMVISCYAVLLIKNRDKKGGRIQAADFQFRLREKAPQLLERTESKYRFMLLLNRIGCSGTLYQKLSASSCWYRSFRRWWMR